MATTSTRPRVPENSGELVEFLRDTNRVAAMLGGNPEAFSEFASDYARAFAGRDPHFADKVAEQRSFVLAKMLREHDAPGGRPIPFGPSASARHALYGREAAGAVLNSTFTDLADFVQSTWHKANPHDGEVQRKQSAIRNAMSSTVPSEGGFLIPETLRSELVGASLESAVVRPRADVIPMSTLRVPVPAIDDTSHATSVHGGIIGYWTEEGAALTESQPSFERIVLDAKKLTAYTELPNELIADAPASQAVVRRRFPEATAFFEDVAFISGSGVGEPLGFLNGGALISVTRDTDSVVWNDVVGMYARMLPSSLNRAVWLISPATLPSVLGMVVPTGNATTTFVAPPLMLTSGGAGAPPMSMLGRPIIVSEKVPNLASAGDICLADFGSYLLGDRQVMTLESSPHYKFANDLTAFRVIERVDGRPAVVSAITPRNGGDTLSPFVTRAA